MYPIDYSQFKEFRKCPWKWSEKYLRGIRLKPTGGFNDTPLSLGSLVHDGLQKFRESGLVEITPESIDKVKCSPEWVEWAQALLTGYIKTYPEERFTEYFCEESLPFKFDGDETTVHGVAKLDAYFRVNEPLVLDSGLNGEYFTLNPGWWIHEYKTKDESRSIGNFLAEYKVNLQPYFQFLALEARVGEMPKGALINVIEKPKHKIPYRVCKSCRNKPIFKDWRPSGDKFACPVCGNEQKLVLPKEDVGEPKYYRIRVEFSAHKMTLAKREIEDVWIGIQAMQNWKINNIIPKGRSIMDSTSCVDSIFGPCEFFEYHERGYPVKLGGKFVAIQNPYEYLGAVQEV